MNPNDQVRRQVLRYFFDRNASSTSRLGKKGSAVKVSDAKRELKAKYGLTQQQVMSNLTYLIDRGWVKVFGVEKTVTVPGGTVPSTVTWYQIAAPGIEKIEGESEFRPEERYAGINITATGSNVITLGDGNIVNARFSTLHTQLNKLQAAIAGSPNIPEPRKFDMAVDIESIKSQLAKKEPETTVIGKLWSGIEAAVTAAGLVDAIAKVEPLIRALLP